MQWLFYPCILSNDPLKVRIQSCIRRGSTLTDENENKPARVLIIDDEQGLRDMLVYGLKKRNFEVTGVDSGEEAVKIVQKQTFDLAVCDVMMPGSDGITTLKQLKVLQPEIEVIMATGFATLETAIEAMKNGAFDYITKPYTLSHLCTLFDKAQDHRRLKAKVGYLEELNRLKSEFMATMSHELRTPLASILGYISLLRKNVYGEVPGKQDNVLERVEVNGKNLLQLINNILDLSKLSAHRMTLDPETFKSADLLKELVEAIEPLTQAKKLALTIQNDDSPWLLADKTKLKQILINLVGNAIKFTKEGSISVRVRTLDETKLEIEVRDTGIGISAADIPRLFQEFQQIDSSTTREYGGTGLGLSISKKMLELMSGTIEVESVVGKGSCFRILLPARIAAPYVPLQIVGEASPPVDPNEKIILSIDDDPDILRLLKDGLEGTGYRFISAQSGEEGIAMARKYHPHLITLDIMMSHMDGWSVLQVFKNDPELRKIPTYVVSIVDNKPLATSLGVTGYILKPFTREDLLEKLKLLPKNRAQQVLVVDDDPQVRSLFGKFLNDEGYDVVGSASGEEALERMKHLKPDILFLDLLLPQMSGFEVLKGMDDMHMAEPPVVFVMAEHELSSEEKDFLSRRVKMIFQKQAIRLSDLLPSLKEKLDSLRKVS